MTKNVFIKTQNKYEFYKDYLIRIDVYDNKGAYNYDVKNLKFENDCILFTKIYNTGEDDPFKRLTKNITLKRKNIQKIKFY